MNNLKRIAKRTPIVGTVLSAIRRAQRQASFPGSKAYWEQNYAQGGTSGAGSYGRYSEYKADVLNRFVQQHNIRSVIEFGSGDGNQLSLANYPTYIGLDVSRTAIQLCANRFRGDSSRSFFLYDPDAFVDNAHLFHADLAISLEVIFHLIEDRVFEQYMRYLFASADQYVIIYSSNTDVSQAAAAPHYKDRRFTTWIDTQRPDWTLLETLPNPFPYNPATGEGATSEFFIFAKR